MPSSRGRQYSRKYTSRPSPPYPANRNCGAVKRGNDGTMWRSSRVGRQTACTWKRVNSKRSPRRSGRRSSRKSGRRRSSKLRRSSRKSGRRRSPKKLELRLSLRRPKGSGWRKTGGWERSVRNGKVSGRVRYEWSR